MECSISASERLVLREALYNWTNTIDTVQYNIAKLLGFK